MKTEKKIEREINRLLRGMASMNSADHYGVRRINGKYRIYTVDTVRFLLTEALKYLDDGMPSQAAEIVFFVKSMYRGD